MILEIQAFLDIAEKFDIIVLLAALVGDPACSVDQQLTSQINYNAIKDFCNQISNNKHIIFMSTCSVYGAQDGLLNETVRQILYLLMHQLNLNQNSMY